MSGALLAIWFIGAVGTCSYYWFTEGRTEQFMVGRMKGFFAFFLWYFFIPYLVLRNKTAAAGRVGTDEAKKRILD
jgi:hypothetical protein